MSDTFYQVLIGGIVAIFASLVGGVPAFFTALTTYRRQREDAIAAAVLARELRAESSTEHKEALKVATDAIAAKVDSKIDAAVTPVIAAIAENTAISSAAVVQAEKAFTEANHVNEKLAALHLEGLEKAQQKPDGRRAGDKK